MAVITIVMAVVAVAVAVVVAAVVVVATGAEPAATVDIEQGNSKPYDACMVWCFHCCFFAAAIPRSGANR